MWEPPVSDPISEAEESDPGKYKLTKSECYIDKCYH